MICTIKHTTPEIFLPEHGSNKGVEQTKEPSHCPFMHEVPSNLHYEKLGNAVGSFLRHLQAAGHAVTSRRCYKGYLERLFKLLGERLLRQISGDDLERAIVELREDFPYSEVTLNKIRSIWRSFFRWAFNNCQLSINPAVGLTLAKTSSMPTIPITADEVAAFLGTIRQSDSPHAARDELLFAIYAFTGIRRTEALSLKMSDYDATSKIFHLNAVKGGGNRIQPVPELLAENVERYLGYLRREELSTDVFLFPSRHRDCPLSARQAQARFVKWKQSSKIRSNLTIHSFRAGFATILYRKTGDIWLVARALGHRNIYTTLNYVETGVEELRESIEIAFPKSVLSIKEDAC